MVQLIERAVEADASHWMSILEDEEREKELSRLENRSRVMESVDEIKGQIRKLNAQATALKMDLHDLAEDLPTGWEKIMDVANLAHQAYKNLDEARKRLAASGS